MASQAAPLLEAAAFVMPEALPEQPSHCAVSDIVWGISRLCSTAEQRDLVEPLLETVKHWLDVEGVATEETVYIAASLMALHIGLTRPVPGTSKLIIKELGVSPLRGRSMRPGFDPKGLRAVLLSAEKNFGGGGGMDPQTADKMVTAEKTQLKLVSRFDDGLPSYASKMQQKLHKKLLPIKRYETIVKMRFEADSRLYVLVCVAEALARARHTPRHVRAELLERIRRMVHSRDDLPTLLCDAYALIDDEDKPSSARHLMGLVPYAMSAELPEAEFAAAVDSIQAKFDGAAPQSAMPEELMDISKIFRRDIPTSQVLLRRAIQHRILGGDEEKHWDVISTAQLFRLATKLDLFTPEQWKEKKLTRRGVIDKLKGVDLRAYDIEAIRADQKASTEARADRKSERAFWAGEKLEDVPFMTLAELKRFGGALKLTNIEGHKGRKQTWIDAIENHLKTDDFLTDPSAIPELF